MLLTLALSLAAVVPQPQAGASRTAQVRQAPSGALSPRPARSLIDELQPGVSPRDLLPNATHSASPFVEVRLLPQARSGSSAAISAAGTIAPRVYEVIVHPGVGYTETFLFQEVVGATPKPLLVAFHKFGNSAYDVLQNTTYFDEARRRGWYCVAPLSASGVHFSSIEGQIGTERALRWVINNFAIDRTRVYGVGFSMGGGAALNYAARHLDPAGVMFAAVANLSGTVSIKNTYVQDPGVQYILDYWFGNNTPGSATAFAMERSSVISFDAVSLLPETGNDLARNLMHLNTRTVTATGDMPYLITQNNVLHSRFLALGASPTQHAHYVYNYPGHSWDAVPERSVCDWLRTQKLVLPNAGSTLADSDERYFYFDVVQDAAGAFTPFTWTVSPLANTVTLGATANLQQITVDLSEAGLSSAAPVIVNLSTADGFADTVRLADWNLLPLNVLRDGIATPLWSFDSVNGVITLAEFDGGNHTWIVQP